MKIFLATSYLVLVGILFVYVGIRSYLDARKIDPENAWHKSRWQIYVPIFMLVATEILARG